MAGEELSQIAQISPYIQPIADMLGVSVTVALAIMIIISIWSLVWKGLALWKASKKNHRIWFIVILLINSIGILEILYIYVFSKMNLKKSKKEEKAEEKPEKKHDKK